MIRRYSGPRTLSPGCTRARLLVRPGTRFAAGLTTMPSPPPVTSSSHQAVAAAVEPGSVVSAKIRRVVMISSGSAAASRSAQSRCH